MAEIGRPNSWYEPSEPNTKTYEVLKVLTYEVEAMNKEEAKELADDVYADYEIQHIEITEIQGR